MSSAYKFKLQKNIIFYEILLLNSLLHPLLVFYIHASSAVDLAEVHFTSSEVLNSGARKLTDGSAHKQNSENELYQAHTNWDNDAVGGTSVGASIRKRKRSR
jgi:hypothetical protein